MSVLANILTGYTTLLDAVSGFEPLVQNQEPHDPAASCHRKFIVKLGPSRRMGDLQMGGSAYDLFRTIRVEFYWDPEGRESTIWSTIADDELSIDDVMLSDSNKPNGVRIVTSAGGSVEELNTRTIRGIYDYEARLTESVSLV